MASARLETCSPQLRLSRICILLPRNEHAGRQPLVSVELRHGTGDVPPSWTGFLGDDSDDEFPWKGNAADVSWDRGARTVRGRTSLTGFPPLFRVETSDWIGVTSDVALTRILDLTPDPAAIAQICTLGFPVNHRTPFEEISLIPAGVEFAVDSERGFREHSSWSPCEGPTFRGIEEYEEEQIRNFRSAISALNVEDAALSLSGGLDTRAIFAGLVDRSVRFPAFTVSGPTPTLDAAIATELCRRQGIPHETVVLDRSFEDDLWDLATEASRRSGGLSSVAAAPQIFCYRQLRVGTRYRGIISGFLGNQIGRGATEGLSRRSVDLRILNEDLRATAPEFDSRWYLRGLESDGVFARRFLIQEENLFASLAGFTIGSSLGDQLCPYSYAPVVEAAFRIPRLEAAPAQILSVPHWVRLRELGRRFLGPRSNDLQARFIRNVGGVPASTPINWGWRPDRKLSLSGVERGLRAFTEEVLTGMTRWVSGADRLLDVTGLRGFSSHLDTHRWVSGLREPVLDLLGSPNIPAESVLDVPECRRVAESFYSGDRDHAEAVVAIIDLLLLSDQFFQKPDAD